MSCQYFARTVEVNITMDSWKIKWFYKYFPFVALVCSIVSELLFWAISLNRFQGYSFFVIWPLALLFWLVYWKGKNQGIKKESYYLFILWIFSGMSLILLVSVVGEAFHFSTIAKQIMYQAIGITFVCFYIILAIYQKKTNSKKQEKQKTTRP